MISLIDYGAGNLRSVQKSIERIGLGSSIISSHKDILLARKLVLPGVGHFKKGVENLKSRNLWDALQEAVIVKKVPILGICLGMQLMTEFSEEGNCAGFGWVKAETVRFPAAVRGYKVPHMGWNQAVPEGVNILFTGIDKSAFFYFVHSYFVRSHDNLDAQAMTNYILPFTSSFQKSNIFGCQFHPEKSHDVGLQLLKNFGDM